MIKETCGQLGSFYVRSRSEKERLDTVKRITEAESIDDKRILAQFVEKAKAAIAFSRQSQENLSPLAERQHSLPDWTSTEIDILSVLLCPLYETRSTQVSYVMPLATAILKAVDPYPDEVVDRDLFVRLLQELGTLLPWESLRISEARESERRTKAMSKPGHVRAEGELLRGDELDELREDFTSHRVFVVDAATASELDDGMAVERIDGADDCWLHIHIADPTRIIPPSHPLATQASFRGGSLYLPDTNLPLLPHTVTMKELSPRRGCLPQRRSTRSHDVLHSSRTKWCGEGLQSPDRMDQKASRDHLQSRGQGIRYRNRGPLSPHSELLPASPPSEATVSDIPPEDLADLKLIRDLAIAYRKRRYLYAGLDWELPKLDLRILSTPASERSNLFDPANLPRRPTFIAGSPSVDCTLPTRTPSGFSATSVVQELMILAGRTAAQFCHQRDIPVPYRGSHRPKSVAIPGQRDPSIENLLASRDPVTQRVDFYEVNSGKYFFSSGGVTLKPQIHWIMGFNEDDHGYLRATSPLRRFEDLLVHWQIRAALAKEAGMSSVAPAIPADQVQTLVTRSDIAQRRVRKASSVAIEFWQIGQMIPRLNGPINDNELVDLSGPLDAKITAPTVYATTGSGSSTTAYLPAIGCIVRYSDKMTFNVGEEIRVKIGNAAQWPNPIVQVSLA